MQQQIPLFKGYPEKAEAGQAKVVPFGSGYYAVVQWLNQDGKLIPQASHMTKKDLQELAEWHSEELRAIEAIQQQIEDL